MAVKRRNKSVYISVYSYTIPAFWLKNPVFPGIFVSIIKYHSVQFVRIAKYSICIMASSLYLICLDYTKECE